MKRLNEYEAPVLDVELVEAEQGFALSAESLWEAEEDYQWSDEE